ncbi:MAG: SDR family oxidoreductase, partial [Desulfobacterales bacterium]|nr:SDR family oxidoreductase [Desulfobacterales bacterium]
MPSVVIAGASGVVGNSALEHFLGAAGWGEVFALSRRKPEVDAVRAFVHLAVDLHDPVASRAALEKIEGVSHLVYAALCENPGVVSGWTDRDLMQANDAMFRNCLEPLMEKGSLRHVVILQGGKAYGLHLHAVPVPARERWPRDEHENFYWMQEDYLRQAAREHGFRWTVLRPRLMIGRPWGVAMNVVPVIGVFAAICREEGIPFGYPGEGSAVHMATDARLLAQAMEWSGLSPLADGEHFNVSNGEVFTWQSLWPNLAPVLGVEPAPDRHLGLAEFFSGKEKVWTRITEKYGLRPLSLREVLGESAFIADYVFSHSADGPPYVALTSQTKIRQAGFTKTIEVDQSFAFVLRDLMARRVIPGP